MIRWTLVSKAALNGMMVGLGSRDIIHSEIFASLRTLQDISGHWVNPRMRKKPFVLLSGVILLRKIHQIDHGLGSEKQVVVEHLNLRNSMLTSPIK